jgi:Protein kinase domain
MPLAPGARLGPYEIVDLIGRGGMGEVYRAVDARLGRAVAIKVLPPELAENGESLERFRREARAIAALSHPNILAIFDVDSESRTPYVVTELLEGETLRTRLQRGPLPLDEMLRVGTAVAEGLAAAHAKGIIHRDLKPENIFLTAAGGVKILDFGLASTLPFAGSVTEGVTLTQPGMVIGTIGYMSPEQLRGMPLTTAADIFPFGCLAYEMLEGEMPFQRDSNMEIIASVLRDEPFRRHAKHSIPDALRALIEKCLVKDPAKRLQNGGELVAELRAISATDALTLTRPTLSRSRGRGLLVFAAVAVLAIVAAAFIVTRRKVLDQGYDLRAGDVTGTSESRRLVGLALRADAAGNRMEAIELCGEAARRDPGAPLPVAFLSSFVYHNGDVKGGLRWQEEARRRMPNARSTYETLLCRYLLPETDSATSMALSSSLLALRPKAWRLRLSLAHRHLDRREIAAMLAHLAQIDVAAPDDRRLALVLADRASLGDVDGARRDLQRSRLMSRPALLAYTQGRIAWSRRDFAEAAKLFDAAAERATVGNQISIAMEARVLGGMARIAAGDLEGAQAALDLAAAKARQAALPASETEAHAFGAYVAYRLGDREGMERRLRNANAIAPAGVTAWASLRLFALRAQAGALVPSAPLRADGDTQNGLASLLAAREAWTNGDHAAAARLLRQSRSEGVDATWFAEEAALLERDLGAPPRAFTPDPPYPNRLRFMAVWELALVLLVAADAVAARGAMAFHYAQPLTPAQIEYYGRFDVLVTHDPLPRAQVDALHARGTKLLLYEWAVAYYASLAAPWQRALPGLNVAPLRGHLGSATADAFYYDPASPRHERERAPALVAKLRAAGYDGVFLDVTTSASVHPAALAEYAKRHPGTPYDAAFARFLGALRRELKGGIIATNQGYRAAAHVLPFVDIDVTESLITRPAGGKYAMRPWNDRNDRWNSTAVLMRQLIVPAQKKYPRVRFVHLNYLDAPDPASVAKVIAIARRFGGEAYVTTPSLDLPVDAPAYFRRK